MARMKYEFRVVFDVDASSNAEDWEVYRDIDTVGKYMYHVLVDEYPGMEGRIKVYPSRSSVEFPDAYQRSYDFDPNYFDRDSADEPEDFIPPTYVKAKPSPPTRLEKSESPQQSSTPEDFIPPTYTKADRPKSKMVEVKAPKPVRRPEPEPVYEEEQDDSYEDEYEGAEDFQPYQADETALEQEYENMLRQQRGEAPRPVQPAKPQKPAMIQYGDPPGEEYDYESDSQADWPSPGMPGRYR